nr:MAG TPA: hypothetical protein [Caudoviricetes sp.]
MRLTSSGSTEHASLNCSLATVPASSRRWLYTCLRTQPS